MQGYCQVFQRRARLFRTQIDPSCFNQRFPRTIYDISSSASWI